MKQFQIHHLFQELGSKLICPKCNNKISVQDLDLRGTSGNTCKFEAECGECGHVLNINAIIETHVTNANTPVIQESSNNGTAFSEGDVEQVKSKLKSTKSIKDLFNS